MTEKKIKKLEEKAYNALSDLLKSESEPIRLRAAKLSSKHNMSGVNSVDETLIKVQAGLLLSDDEKVRMKAVELILGQNSAKDKEPVVIPSPYEKWYKKHHKLNGERRKGHESGTFEEYWFKKTRYTPHESQQLIHNLDKRFIVCICGRRFGKTLLAAKEAQLVLMQPNRRVWVVAPTYALADKVFREIYDDLVIKKNLPKGSIVRKSASERHIKLAWGSEVIGKTSDRPDSLLGEAVDLIIFDECAKANGKIWEKYLRPTLTDRAGRAIFITTPEGTNWVHKLYKRGQKKNRDWGSFSFPTDKNPHISSDDILEAKRTLPKEVFNQEYMADFFTFSGKVYKDFLRTTHVL